MTALSIDFPPELVEEIARRAAEIVASQSALPRWMNTEQAAEYMCCKPARIRDLVSQGKLKPRKDGTRNLYLREDIDAYLDFGPPIGQGR